MKVKLINYTTRPLEVIFTAARTCYSHLTPQEIWRVKKTKKQMQSLVDKIIKLGHESVLEHISFTFAIEGISRACSHQLVRHRLASYSQQSQRYVRFKNRKEMRIVTPSAIRRKKALLDKFEETIGKTYETYQMLIEKGIRPEDARYVLPNAVTTNILVTMNLRELRHVAGLRLDPHAQWEIRGLLKEIKREIYKKEPFLSRYLAASE
ncbi:MAG: FAD-dependent thymidylate synthase [Candidatus Edwardsbacteria bacterium]